MIKAILFDMDGVIVDTMPAHFMAWQKFFKKYEIILKKKEWIELIGLSTKETMEVIAKENNLDIDINESVKEKERIAMEILKKTEVFPNVLETLDLLKNYKLALVTSASKDMVDFNFLNKEILDCFDVILTADDVEKAKPDPEIYNFAALKLNIMNNECLVVEDTPLGIESAKRAGMKCVAITNTLPKERLSNADYVIGDICELPRLIKRL